MCSTYIYCAYSMLAMKDMNAALRSLEKALALDPGYAVDPRYADAYLNRARKAVQGNGLDAAIQDFTTASKLRAGSVPAAEFADCYRRRAKARQDAGQRVVRRPPTR